MARFRVEVFKLTEDDWHPAYRLASWFGGRPGTKLVTVACVEMTNGESRVCVWGSDDDGLEKDLPDLASAGALFDYVIRQKYVNKQWLRDIGFVQA